MKKMILYQLHHYHIEADQDELNFIGEPNEKWIGVFSSEQMAEVAMNALRQQPGFRKWPHGFRLNELEVDTWNWPEGFVTTDGSGGEDDFDAPLPGS